MKWFRLLRLRMFRTGFLKEFSNGLVFQYIPVCRLGWHVGKPKIMFGNVIWQIYLWKICISKYRQDNQFLT